MTARRRRRVVISGAGVIAPNGFGLENFRRACLHGTAAVEHVPTHWAEYAPTTSTLWAPLPPLDYASMGITRIERMQLDPATMLALGAAGEALRHAGLRTELLNEKKNTYRVDAIDPRRAAVYLGTGVGGLTTLIGAEANHVFSPQKALLKRLATGPSPEGEKAEALDALRGLMRMPPRFNPFVVSMMMPNACGAMIGIRYGFKGPNLTCCCACAAGTTALGRAFRGIREGECDMALAGGTEYLRDDFGGIYRGFDTANVLVRDCDDPARANRPFDKARSGFLLAEGGAGMMVVEELEHARARGATPLAEIVGYGESFDAWSVMGIEPSAGQIERMLRDALADAGCGAGEVDYVNAHGTGTEANDPIEASLIERVFGPRVAINATKSLTGHMIGASGAVEAIVTAMSIGDNRLHPCANLNDPVAPLNFVTPDTTHQPITTAVSQSFAFGGHNAAVVLRWVE